MEGRPYFAYGREWNYIYWCTVELCHILTLRNASVKCVLRHVVRDLQSRYSIPSLANLWHACPKWHTERFSWHAGCTADPLFTSFARPMSLYCEQHLFIQVSHELRSLLRESVPYVKIYRYNPRHLRPKLNGYGDNDKRKVWTS